MCNIKTVQDMYQYIEIPSAREQLVEGSVPIRAFQYCHNTSPYTPLERLFPCSHTCFTCERWHTLYVNEGIAIARGVYFLLDHTCTPPRMLHVWTIIDKKIKKIILNTVYTCTLEVNRLFLNINVTLMSGHSTHGPWCHCLLLVSGTGGEGYLIHIVTILHILHLKNTMFKRLSTTISHIK